MFFCNTEALRCCLCLKCDTMVYYYVIYLFSQHSLILYVKIIGEICINKYFILFTLQIGILSLCYPVKRTLSELTVIFRDLVRTRTYLLICKWCRYITYSTKRVMSYIYLSHFVNLALMYICIWVHYTDNISSRLHSNLHLFRKYL